MEVRHWKTKWSGPGTSVCCITCPPHDTYDRTTKCLNTFALHPPTLQVTGPTLQASSMAGSRFHESLRLGRTPFINCSVKRESPSIHQTNNRFLASPQLDTPVPIGDNLERRDIPILDQRVRKSGHAVQVCTVYCQWVPVRGVRISTSIYTSLFSPYWTGLRFSTLRLPCTLPMADPSKVEKPGSTPPLPVHCPCARMIADLSEDKPTPPLPRHWKFDHADSIYASRDPGLFAQQLFCIISFGYPDLEEVWKKSNSKKDWPELRDKAKARLEHIIVVVRLPWSRGVLSASNIDSLADVGYPIARNSWHILYHGTSGGLNSTPVHQAGSVLFHSSVDDPLHFGCRRRLVVRVWHPDSE